MTDTPRPVRPLPFLAALILAPLVPSGLGLGVILLTKGLGAISAALAFPLMVLVFAAPFGAPTYLTFGTAGFWHAIRSGAGIAGITGVAFTANLASAFAVYPVFWLSGARDAAGATAFIVGFGLIFAPLWGAIFGALYGRFARIAPA